MKKVLLFIVCCFFGLQVFAQTPLKVGDKAPLFVMKDNNGKVIDLKKEINKQRKNK